MLSDEKLEQRAEIMIQVEPPLEYHAPSTLVGLADSLLAASSAGNHPRRPGGWSRESAIYYAGADGCYTSGLSDQT
jgi:hypothetical protein